MLILTIVFHGGQELGSPPAITHKMQKSEVETHVALVQEGMGHLDLAFWPETFSELFLQKGQGL